MNIQSLSVCVPAGCPNDCKFCISDMNETNNKIEKNTNFTEIRKRMEYARDNGCNVLLFTGTGEPATNPDFVKKLGRMNENLPSPFKHIEFQTSGYNFEKRISLLEYTGVQTISLSVANIFNNESNRKLMGAPSDYPNLEELSCSISEHFNLRISINLLSLYKEFDFKEIFHRLKELKANQVTFRLLTVRGNGHKARWTKNNRDTYSYMENLNSYVKEKGKPLNRTPYGQMKYSMDGISTVIDDDCLSEEAKQSLKYLIINKDSKLYSQWDDKGSLIF